MTLGQLSRAEVRARLARERIRLRTGPFVLSVRTPIEKLADALATLYADFPIAEATPFSDFHIDIVARRGLRRWVRPQATFSVDGFLHRDSFRAALSIAYFEWALNAHVSQRANQFLILHGAVVERAGRAVVLLGQSGAGKSTLCAGLVVGGWRLLSDELTLIVPGSTLAVPLARPISLKAESIALVRSLDGGTIFGPRMMTLRKGLVTHMRPPSSSVERMDEPARVCRFVFVRYEAGASTAWERLAPGIALTEIAKQSFNYGLRGRKGFDHLAQLVNECPCHVLTHGGVHEAIQAIEHDEPAVTH